MADSKVTALTADTSVDSADLGYTIEDPGGTPVSKKATWLNILKGAALGVLTSDGDLFTRTGGVLSRLTRAALAADAAFSSTYAPLEVPGKLIASVFYANGSDGATYTTTSTSLVDVDATNLSVTFTVPASGAVLVVLSAACREPGGNNVFFGLRVASSDVAGSTTNVTANAGMTRPYVAIKVTGLTPGASVTYKFAFRCDAGTAAIWTGPTRGKAVMEVYAA